MNKLSLVAGITLLSLTAGTAVAQTSSDTGARPGNIIGTGNSLPTSTQASHITAGSGTTIAPRLPDPGVAAGSGAKTFLISAHRALAAGHTGEAQEALERAETRLLDRSVAQDAVNTPDATPMIAQIDAALKAVAAHDTKSALNIIQAAIEHAG